MSLRSRSFEQRIPGKDETAFKPRARISFELDSSPAVSVRGLRAAGAGVRLGSRSAQPRERISRLGISTEVSPGVVSPSAFSTGMAPATRAVSTSKDHSDVNSSVLKKKKRPETARCYNKERVGGLNKRLTHLDDCCSSGFAKEVLFFQQDSRLPKFSHGHPMRNPCVLAQLRLP